MGAKRLWNLEYVPIRSACFQADFHLSCAEANSGEFIEDADNSVVMFMPEVSRTHMGGTMRLGLRPTVFVDDTKDWSRVRQLYGGADKIWERHRHRYEVNPRFVERIESSGLRFTGKDEKGERMQVFELKGKTDNFFSHLSLALCL